eukprot:Pompholyxophrys_punicea_v1_NODE_429_length_1988_cov_7.455768.p1 type:complete len:152 gc:universal NODE_429_length_1988_cov_7.455768:1475-1930(+)
MPCFSNESKLVRKLSVRETRVITFTSLQRDILKFLLMMLKSLFFYILFIFLFFVCFCLFGCLFVFRQRFQVTQYGAGGSFGELALLYGQPRAATVRSTTASSVWAVDRLTFRRIVMVTTFQKRKQHEAFLKVFFSSCGTCCGLEVRVDFDV